MDFKSVAMFLKITDSDEFHDYMYDRMGHNYMRLLDFEYSDDKTFIVNYEFSDCGCCTWYEAEAHVLFEELEEFMDV